MLEAVRSRQANGEQEVASNQEREEEKGERWLPI